jgi:hypothetical protein
MALPTQLVGRFLMMTDSLSTVTWLLLVKIPPGGLVEKLSVTRVSVRATLPSLLKIPPATESVPMALFLLTWLLPHWPGALVEEPAAEPGAEPAGGGVAGDRAVLDHKRGKVVEPAAVEAGVVAADRAMPGR